ncbi:caspase-3-like [Gigantopelta aegis]|uniref:caspase-3-like n=1 Tax=Gigantopelta aegis TaxID=1735272 RepID=UPI001B8884E7|nr:caspase-3-like [Gigantopelta aegis]
MYSKLHLHLETMAKTKVDVFGSSSELKRLEHEEKITFKEYKYRCYYAVKGYHVCGVYWDVCIWLTSFPSELQEMRDFRNDSTFCTYSMDIITLESSSWIKAIIRKTGRDGFFSLVGKHLNDVLVLISESETKDKKQVAPTEQTLSIETPDEEQVTSKSGSSTEHQHEDPSSTFGEKKTSTAQEVGDTTTKQMKACSNSTSSLSTANKKADSILTPGGNEPGIQEELVEMPTKPMKPSSYKMTSTPRGICMIISNEDFYSLTDPTKLEKRHGALQDVEKLSKMFTRLQFKVVLFRNLRDNEVVMTAKHMSLNDHSHFDCFVCCILSHGTQGSVYGVNHVAVPISDVLSQFRSRACHTLAGKPKLFFIQACQGLEPQIGVAVTDTPSVPQPAKLAADGTDFLVAYSTEPGYVAFRHRKSGSYFIDALVTNLEGLPDFSVHDVMAKVCDDVSQLNINNGFKQVPQFTSTLTKQLVLARGSLAVQSHCSGETGVQQEDATSPTLIHTFNDDVSSHQPKHTKKVTKTSVCVIS